MKYGLVEFVMHLNCNYLVVCLNLGKHELSFVSTKIIFGMDK